MRNFLAATALAFLSWTSSPAADFTPVSAAVLEAAVRNASPDIRAQLVTVGRTSLAVLHPGVVLDEAGHILSAHLATIDGVPTPYLIYAEDGSRSTAETVWEDAEAGLAIIKSSAALPRSKQPVMIASDDTFKTCSWLLAPSFPPAVLPGDRFQLHIGQLLTLPSKSDPIFNIDVRLRGGGYPLFDVAGRLAGLTTKRVRGTEGFSAVPMFDLIERYPELAKLLPEPKVLGLPELPYFLPEEPEDEGDEEDESEEQKAPANPARDALIALATRATVDVPTVAIFNHAGVSTTGVHGVIIDTDGIVLTKASEIGGSPMVQFGEESYPAILLATDTATDLALLSIEAKDLPVVQWSDVVPIDGTLIHSPQVHTAPPFDFTTTSGLLSHRLAAHPASSLTVHSPERITSLGIVPEQDEDVIKVGAILPEGPAVEAGVQRGDVIQSIDGKELAGRSALLTILDGHKVGDQVSLDLRRGEEQLKVSLKLGGAHLRLPVTEPLLGGNSASMIITTPSVRRSGFPETFVHDLVIEHWQNGSPICDSKGRVLGINIATVTYDRTLALPVPSIKQAIARMRSTKITF